MRTEGLVFASRQMMAVLQKEEALAQVRNVATLPGMRQRQASICSMCSVMAISSYRST
jgi:tRNA-splicing ligase RtcB